MKKIIILLFVFLTISVFCQETLVPEKTVSFGLNKHTNRDEAFFTHIDSNKNTLLVGTTERDSTFTDILSTKLNEKLEVIWQKRFSVPTNLSYDLPIKSYLDTNNNLIIIGRSSFNESRGNGLIFVIKYSSDGEIIFKKTIGGNVDGKAYTDYSFIETELTNDNVLTIVFSPIKPNEYAKPLIYFSFNENGNLIKEYEKFMPFHDIKGFIKNKDFYFLRSKEEDIRNISFKFQALKNDGTLTSKIITDENFKNYYLNSHISSEVKFKTSENLSHYLVNQNKSSHSKKDRIMITKITDDIIYTVQTPVDSKYFLIDNFIDENNLHIVIVNNLTSNKLQFLSIENNEIIVKKEISEYLATGFKLNKDGSFFITSNNSTIKLFSKNLEEINSFTTSNSYKLIDFCKYDENSISSTGIEFNKMFPSSGFYSQLDIIAEKITNNIEYKYKFSGEGTSSSFQQRIFIDNNNNYIVFASEKKGPQCYFIGCNSPPIDDLILKYDSNFNLIWKKEFNESYDAYIGNTSKVNIFFDSDNNFYYTTYKKIEGSCCERLYYLNKISPNGDLVYKKEVLQAAKKIIFEEKDNILFIISDYYSKDLANSNIKQTSISKYNSENGDFISTSDYEYLKFLKNFKEGDDFYFYLTDDCRNSDSNYIYLYKNEELLFKRYVSNVTYDCVKNYELLDDNSLFIVLGDTYSPNDYFQKITVTNQYSYSGNLNENFKTIKKLPNNNLLLLNDDNFLLTYDNNFNFLNKSENEYGRYTLFNNNLIFHQAYWENFITVLDYNLKVFKTIIIEKGYLHDWYSKFDNNNNLLIVNSIGNSIYSHSQYGWSRGFLSKYNLEDVLSINENRQVNTKNNIIVFPNPSKNFFYTNIDYEKIKLYDSNGKFIKNIFSKEIDLTNYNRGIYFIKIFTNDSIYNSKIIKN